jgi:hypothetical protein
METKTIKTEEEISKFFESVKTDKELSNLYNLCHARYKQAWDKLHPPTEKYRWKE